MNSRKILAAATLIGVAMAGKTALAATIDATYSGSANFGGGAVGYETGWVAPNPNSSTNPVGVGIGGDTFTSANHSYGFSETGQFITWCVDIYHWMTGGTVTYNVDTGGDLAAQLSSLRPGSDSGETRVGQLLVLADEVYSSVLTETSSAAFQLAVWAITYGTPDSSGHYQINTTDPGFHVDSGTANSAWGVLANQWLAELGSVGNTGFYTLTYLDDGAQEITQDVVAFTQATANSNSSPIPEPATLALLSFGLAGYGFNRRKKTGVAVDGKLSNSWLGSL